MNFRMAVTGVAAACVVFSAAQASAQTTAVTPVGSTSTTLTAIVSEQAHVTVPPGVTFEVNDIAVATNASPAGVTVTNIALASETKQLKISVQANAATFTPSVAQAATWEAGDVTWNAPSYANAVGASGILSSSVYTEVATCDPDVSACSTSGLVFTLDANTNVKRSGNHTLAITWKFESIDGGGI